MNGNGFRHGSYGSSQSSRYGPGSGPASPPSKVLLDGYKGSFEKADGERPRYDTVRQPTQYPISVARWFIEWPRLAQVETTQLCPPEREWPCRDAFTHGDSHRRQPRIRSPVFEEVDGMKRECSLLYHRIEATKRKLTLRASSEMLRNLWTDWTQQEAGKLV
jgi:hypothetical protein